MKSDEQITAELRRGVEGLLWMSEADYPFEAVRWEQVAAVTPEFLRHIAAEAPEAPVVSQSIDDFFRPALTLHEGQRREAELLVHKYRGLVQTIEANLRDVRVYRVGRINIAVYVVGRAPSGALLGIATRVVET